MSQYEDPHRGAILVFLPGLGEITQLMLGPLFQGSGSFLGAFQ